MADLMAIVPSLGPDMVAKALRNEPMGVRAALTITTSCKKSMLVFKKTHQNCLMKMILSY